MDTSNQNDNKRKLPQQSSNVVAAEQVQSYTGSNFSERHQFIEEPNLGDETMGSSSSSVNAPRAKNIKLEDIVPDFGASSLVHRDGDMEDAFSTEVELCCPMLTNYRPIHFFGVFGGHGGSQVADLYKHKMHHFLMEGLLNEKEKNEGVVEEKRWGDVLENTFAKMDDDALGVCKSNMPIDDISMIGSTAIITTLTHNKIIIANCGDSRAVLSRGGRVIPLSLDHKPNSRREYARIVASGGFVINLDCPRVMGMLPVSRTIGGWNLKPVVISKPEILFAKRTTQDEFVIVGSKGMWERVSNDRACGVVRKCLFGEDATADAQESKCRIAARMLTRLALGQYTCDSITAVVINLKRC